MERSPEEGLPLGLRRQGVQFKEKIFKTKRRERQGSVGRHPGLLRTAVLRVWSGNPEVTEILWLFTAWTFA